MITGKKFFVISILTFLLMSINAFATAIDLSTWSSPDSNGNWVVSSDHTSVTQTRNDSPTIFLSDTEYSNTVFNGRFTAPNNWDNDFIGFVFGYQSSTDYLLFDWKQGYQSYAEEGFTLSKITGSNLNFWTHTGDDIDVLATKYGSDQGWSDGQTYEFTLEYTTNSIEIIIDGAEIFNVTGNFSSGKFGFYNYSQEDVTYQGFDQQAAPVPEPATFLLFGLGFVGVAGIGKIRFKKKSSK